MPSSNDGPTAKVNHLSAKLSVPAKAVQPAYIITEYGALGKALIFSLLIIAFFFTLPLWLSPLLGMTVLQGYVFYGILFLSGQAVMAFYRNWAYSLLIDHVESESINGI